MRPNAGRIEPGDSAVVSVQLQPMKEEPPLTLKCKDKFLVQSTTITADKELLSLSEIVSESTLCLATPHLRQLGTSVDIPAWWRIGYESPSAKTASCVFAA